MNTTHTAVVDRIIDGETVVILIENSDGDVIDEYNLPVEDLPDEADEGSVLKINMEGGDIVMMEHPTEETNTRRQSAQDRFYRLSEKLSDS